MSQSEFTARRPDDAAAAKGWEIFLCEQRIESNWRILLTMDFFCTEPTSGRFPQETPGAGQMGLPSQKVMQWPLSCAANQ
jgi:hypothetical protein